MSTPILHGVDAVLVREQSALVLRMLHFTHVVKQQHNHKTNRDVAGTFVRVLYSAVNDRNRFGVVQKTFMRLLFICWIS
jgi:hypothetical protein